LTNNKAFHNEAVQYSVECDAKKSGG